MKKTILVLAPLAPRRRHLAAVLSAMLLGACAPRIATVPPSLTQSPDGAEALTAIPAPIDAATLEGKLMFGYQGWFGCPTDGSRLQRWNHWFRPGGPAGPATLRVDMWPDTSELPAADRCPAPLTMPDGRAAELYSAYRPATVDVHFRWLREYDLAGVFLQRFTVRLDDPAMRDFRDTVARNVRIAAETHGRVFAVMYDISGDPSATVVDDIKRDWTYLVDELRLVHSPRYLRERGLPLVAIWGCGFTDRAVTPDQAAELIEFFKNGPNPRARATVLGGVPAGWRTLRGDSQSDARWAAVYRSFHILSPWTVGRFQDDQGVARFYDEVVAGDIAETRALGIGYLPVLFPGFSWRNMNADAPFNQIPRRGGRFFWGQVEHALRAGSTMLYGAMFDEVDEGTAMFKTARAPGDAPAQPPTVTLDVEGVPLPGDWYLRLAREAQLMLNRGRVHR